MQLLTFPNLFLALVLLGTTQTTRVAVTLSSFSVKYDSDNEEMKLIWETQTELETAGYFIIRSTNQDELLGYQASGIPSGIEYVALEIDGDETEYVQNQGSATSGATYTAFDAGPTDGFGEDATYYYLLVERELSGNVIAINDSEALQSAIVGDIASHKIFIPIAIR